MEPENFVRDVLCRSLKAKYVVVGTDFHFGHNRGGDVNLLNALQERYGYRLIVVEKEQYQGREISSTFVREALSAGNMRLVENLLGAPYPIEGVIRHGRHLGHTFGMPTINLVPAENKLLPPFGVYYSEAMVSAEGEADMCRSADSVSSGFRCPGITNIGCKPTVDGSFAGAETYLYGVDEDLYGRFVRLMLHDFRRREQKFSSVEELKAQMQRDIAAGAEYAGISSDSAHTGAEYAGISSDSAHTGAEYAGISSDSAHTGAEYAGISSDSDHTGAEYAGISSDSDQTGTAKDGAPNSGQTGRTISAADFPGRAAR